VSIVLVLQSIMDQVVVVQCRCHSVALQLPCSVRFQLQFCHLKCSFTNEWSDMACSEWY